MSNSITQIPRNEISRADAKQIIAAEDAAFREVVIHTTKMDAMSAVAQHCVHRTANTLEQIQADEKRFANLGSIAERVLLLTEEFKLQYARRMHDLGLSAFDGIDRIGLNGSR